MCQVCIFTSPKQNVCNITSHMDILYTQIILKPQPTSQLWGLGPRNVDTSQTAVIEEEHNPAMRNLTDCSSTRKRQLLGSICIFSILLLNSFTADGLVNGKREAAQCSCKGGILTRSCATQLHYACIYSCHGFNQIYNYNGLLALMPHIRSTHNKTVMLQQIHTHVLAQGNNLNCLWLLLGQDQTK